MSHSPYLFAFFLSLSLFFVAVAFLGNALPGRFGSYVPSVPLVREENVLVHAVKDTDQPCVGLFGDSRVAFNISGAVVDRSLPEKCETQNYGFPAVGLAIMRQLSEVVKPRVAVLSPTEPMLSEPMWSGPMSSAPVREAWTWHPFWEDLPNDLERLMVRHFWSRRLYLGYSRSARSLQYLLNPNLQFDDGWDWSRSEKRWQSSAIKDRHLTSLPSYGKEAADMAAVYFSNKEGAHRAELASFVAALRDRGMIVILLIPPSEQLFRSQPVAAVQREIWQIVHSVAGEFNAPVIDCSVAEACGVQPFDFADPVHLNDHGVEAYSAFLGSRIRAILPRTDSWPARDATAGNPHDG